MSDRYSVDEAKSYVMARNPSSARQFDSGAVHSPRGFAESGDLFAGERRMNLGSLYADSYADSGVQFGPKDRLSLPSVDLRSAAMNGLESPERPHSIRFSPIETGDPGRARTSNLQLRRLPIPQYFQRPIGYFK